MSIFDNELGAILCIDIIKQNLERISKKKADMCFSRQNKERVIVGMLDSGLLSRSKGSQKNAS